MTKNKLVVLRSIIAVLFLACFALPASATAKTGWVKATARTIGGLPAAPSDYVLQQLGASRLADYPAFTLTFTVADQSKKTVLVLAWSDEPAAASATKTLVRDLNMEIIASTDRCLMYTGNQFKNDGSEISRLQGGPFANCGVFTYDSTNNVELIVLPANSMSTFTLDIFLSTWGSGSHNQKFAVYASNAY